MRDEWRKKDCAGCGKTPKWKQDFPIEWEGDHYVTRREMVKFMTLGSLLLAGANWITAIAGKLVHRGSRAERDIGAASALQQTGSLLFRYPTDAGPMHRCPHAGRQAGCVFTGLHASVLRGGI